MAKKKANYEDALQGKEIPILPLDEKWRLLFGEEGLPEEAEELARELTEKLEEQTKLREKNKDVKRLKKKLMGEIMELHAQMTSEGQKSQAARDLDDHTRLINECNEKIAAIEDSLIDLPREIYKKNYQLMLMTMDICYARLHANSTEIERIEGWLSEIRKELKKEIIRKQEGEIENFNMYSYMHQIFGPEVIEIFDMHYDPGQKHPIRTMSAESRRGMLE